MDQKTLARLAKMHGTPLVVVDHKVLRENYAQFRKHLPRVQVYYAVKANSGPAIVQTFYDAGASFGVASMAEFLNVHEKIKHLPAEERQNFIWDRSSTRIRSKQTKRWNSWIHISRWSPTITTTKLSRLPAMHRIRGWCCGCACPTPDQWWSYQASLALCRARPWT